MGVWVSGHGWGLLHQENLDVSKSVSHMKARSSESPLIFLNFLALLVLSSVVK